MNTPIPYITDIIYSSLQLQITWTPSSDSQVTAYVVNIAYGNGTVALSKTFTVTWSSSIQPITEIITFDNGALDSNIVYFVTVSTQWGTTPGQDETSQSVTLITQIPELIQSYYDGTDLWFEWIPTVQATQGYILQAVQGTQTYFSTIASPSSSIGKIPGSSMQLSPSLPCIVFVSAAGYIGENGGNGGQVTAASASIPLPTGLPGVTVSSADYQRNTGLTVGWTVAQTTEIVRYQLVVTSSQDHSLLVSEILSGTATSGVLPIPNGLSSSLAYNLRVIALTALGGGISSALIPLVSTIPQLNSIVYNDSAHTLTLGWNALSNSSIATYNLVVSPLVGSGSSVRGSATGAAVVTGTIALPTGGLSATLGWAAQVSAVAGMASATCNWAPVYVVSPGLQQIGCEGTDVTLIWTPVTAPYYQAPSGYYITLSPTSGGAPIASTFVAGRQASSGSVRLPPSTTSCNVQIALVNDFSFGPPSAAVSPILSAPVLGGVATSAVSGIMTLSWPLILGATNYQLTFNGGVAAGSAATNSYSLPSTTLLNNAPLAVVMTATATSGSILIVGPTSQSFAIPTTKAIIKYASYNGSVAMVGWHAVAGATSYTITALGTTGSSTVVVGSGSSPTFCVEIPFAATKGTLYSVVVQANTGNYVGPVSDAASLFASGLFVSQTNATSCYPFIYPATVIDTVLESDTAKTGESITLYLPEITDGSGLGAGFTQGAFTLSANKTGYPYTLTISNTVATNNPWSFGIVAPATQPAAVRNGLRTDYITFLQLLEKNGALPWGVQYVQQILGRVLPQTFAELLYYNYGLMFPDPTAGITSGSIDLRPGMVLRLAASPFQMVPGQTTTTNSWLDGFVGGPVLDYDFGSTVSNAGNWGTGFDAFVSQLVNNGAMQVTAPSFNRTINSGQGAADVTDLYYPTFTGPFYRMFVPSKLMAATNTPGSITIADNFVLAPATSYTTLCDTSNTLSPSGNNVLSYFRGRAVIKLCIRVSLNGMEKLVPIGTTLGNLLEQVGGLPPIVAGAIQNVLLERAMGGAIVNANDPVSAATYYPVRLNWSNSNPALYGVAWGPTSMPLLAGDRITIPTYA